MTEDSEEHLSRLLYTSRMAPLADGIDVQEQVERMASASAERNAQAGLTGSLVFVDGQFIQILEGPPDAVEETFERICCDFRHDDIRLIDLITVRGRLFAGWDLACLTESTEATLNMRDDLQELRFLVGVNARQAVRQMRALLDAQPAMA